ncbi:ankyrin [Panus rudis PR-1116 ss-1]|nr:ankyrin [Panus rudis PR-1116 ss-1]
MPVPTRVLPEKNIWIAAGDGDLDRELVEEQSFSPNVPDENTYTPMHAAASYGHIHVLEYLISKGGNVNITDNDDDTPLYVVEDIETAKFLIDRGAVVDRQNADGVSPAAYLAEDFPEVAAYVESRSTSNTSTTSNNSTTSLTSTSPHPPSQPHPSQHPTHPTIPSQHAQNLASEHLTSTLIDSVQQIMQRAEREGREPDEELLRRVVERTVVEGVVRGYGLSVGDGDGVGEDEMDEGASGSGRGSGRGSGDGQEGETKRPRTEGGA